MEKLTKFLEAVDCDFPVPLSRTVNLNEYAKKLKDKATLCFEEREGEILSLVAGYTDNLTENMAYIAIVATIKDGRGKGYAKKLLHEFLEICKSKSITAVHLYAVKTNTPAVNMYKNIGFEMMDIQDIPEKYHLIYYF